MTSVWHLLREDSREYDPLYHEHARTEIFSLLIRQPRVVLDVGCGAGATVRLLRERYPEIVVLGVEPNSQLQSRAQEVCAEFYCQTIGEFLDHLPDQWRGKVDTVILDDVLEHLVDPFSCLERLHDLLTEDAQLLVSIPNIRNACILDLLAQGHFSYAPAGILDITHLRFFTRQDAERMFDEAGYSVGDIKVVADQRATGILTALEGKEAATPLLTIKEIDEKDFQELTALQFFFLLQRKGYGLRGAAAIQAIPGPEAEGKAPGASTEELEQQKRFYHAWALQRTLTPARRAAIENGVAGMVSPETFHLCLFATDEQADLVKETCFALEAQLYPHWHLTVLSFEPPGAWWKDHPQCTWQVLGDDDDSLESTNRELMQREATWVGLVYPGDRLPPEALFLLADSARRHREWQWIYTDEDRLTAGQERVQPLFKPDFNPDLLRSLHYTGGVSVVRRTVFAELGGFDSDFEGIEDYDLALRLATRLSSKQVGHLAEMLYHRHENGRVSHLTADEIWDLGQQALARHCHSLGWQANVGRGPSPLTWRIRYPLSANPSVAILIPTRDHFEDLHRCVESVLGLTDYPNYEIVIIDNQSSDERTLAYLAELQGRPRMRVQKYDAPFNFSAMNNRAVEKINSEYVVLLNNDTAVLAADWLTTLLGYAQVAEAGVVGPLLVYESGRVQHAGVVMGLGNMAAEHIHIGMSPHSSVVLERLRLTQNYSAVTGACLLVRREDYLAVGGLDEESLPRTYQDIDFCLKISSQLGKRIIWTPEVRLIHQGSKTFNRLRKEKPEKLEEPVASEKQDAVSPELKTMFERWGPLIAQDPHYNRNLSLSDRAGGIETEPLLSRGEWRAGPTVVASPNDNTGCGEYRIMAPMRTLLNAGRVDGGLTARIFGPAEIMRIRPDVVVLQRQMEYNQVQAIPRYQKYASSFVIYELDDLITVGWSKAMSAAKKETIRKHLRMALESADRFIASTPRIAEEYGDWCRETIVVPNYLPLDRWGAVQARRLGKARPRVGWAGGGSHAADLEMIADVVKILQHEVEWVFLGLCPEALRPYVHEYHPGVPIEGYPARLASLNLDLALAPLEDTDFNRARTALRILEYGILGYPVIASDMPSYQMGFPVTLTRNNVDDWVSAIRTMIADRDGLAAAGDRLRQHVLDHWIMDRNLDVWYNAWVPK